MARETGSSSVAMAMPLARRAVMTVLKLRFRIVRMCEGGVVVGSVDDVTTFEVTRSWYYPAER